jgi:phosphohistidine phosphatase
VLLVGHNPGMEELALALARPPKREDGRRHVRRLRKKFPTGALAVLDFNATAWAAILPQRGHLSAFVRPKDISSGNRDGT